MGMDNKNDMCINEQNNDSTEKNEYIDIVNITRDEGIVKKIISYSNNDNENERPEKGQEVIINYEGRTEDGTVFSSSYDDKEKMKIQLGEISFLDTLSSFGPLLIGLHLTVATMRKGEKSLVTFQSKHTFKDERPEVLDLYPLDIPLYYELEVIDFYNVDDDDKDFEPVTEEVVGSVDTESGKIEL